MPISGPVVHRQLMDSFTQGQARLEEVRGQTSPTHDQREDLDDDRGKALVRLAEHYLPELTQDAIRNTWGEIRASVTQVLLRKEDHRGQLQQLLHTINSRRVSDEADLVKVTKRLDEAVESQHQISEKVEVELRKDSEFVSLADRAAVAEASLERAEANMSEIDQDSARKLPGFDESALFRYLYERGFGTSSYTKRGLTRRVDRWLAKYIDYRKARESYEFLRKTPEQMRAIIAEDRAALDTVMDELERKRDTLADALGLPEQMKTCQDLMTERDHMLAKLEEARKETERVEHELSELEQKRDPYYREAIMLFREMLERVDSHDLERRARATLDITDDQIVAQLQGVEVEIHQLENATHRWRQQLDEMQGMLDALGRLIQRFRTAGYDSARAQFVGTLDVVEGLRRAVNADDVENLWQEIREAHSWGPSTLDKLAKVASHPMTQILVNAMAHAAVDAMSDHARRAGHRRGSRYPRWSNNRGAWFSDSSSDVFRF